MEEEDAQKQTPREVFRNAEEFLPSVLSTPSRSGTNSMITANQDDSMNFSGIHASSILNNESAHASFYNPNETSFMSSVPRRRRSIRESQYESLLRSETKRVATYSGLFDDSVRLSPSAAEKSLFRMSSSVSNISEIKSADTSIISTGSINNSDASPDHSLSHLSSRLSAINEATRTTLVHSPSPAPTSPSDAMKKEVVMREEMEEPSVEIEPASFDEESTKTLSSQEETAIRNLLSSQPDEPSQLQPSSLMEDSMMPPPTQPLHAKLRIPLKGVSRAGRKKGQKNDE